MGHERPSVGRWPSIQVGHSPYSPFASKKPLSVANMPPILVTAQSHLLAAALLGMIGSEWSIARALPNHHPTPTRAETRPCARATHSPSTTPQTRSTSIVSLVTQLNPTALINIPPLRPARAVYETNKRPNMTSVALCKCHPLTRD